MDLNLKNINANLVNVGELEFIQELDTYELPYRVYDVYRHITKDNDNISYEECKKKLIRNIILGHELHVKPGREYKRVFSYKDMLIHINIEERNICYIKTLRNWVNFEKKATLDEIMGIGNIDDKIGGDCNVINQ